MNIDIYKYGEKYKLTEAEELALKFIVNNIEESLKLGVRGIAKKCFSSSSVVMNLSKKLGYKGFIDMIYKLKHQIENESLINKNENSLNTFDENDSVKTKLFLELLAQYRDKPIYVNGVGFSRIIANYFVDKLTTLGFYAMFTEYMECVENPQVNSPLFIVISKSGETSAVVSLCEKSKKSNAKILSFVGLDGSTVELLSKICFHVKNKNPMDDRNVEENDFFANCILSFESLIGQYLSNLN
ncbi:MAG: MurR/RpiR family transcriptional regulator [Fusobacteriaceae bacterium]